VRSDLLDRFGSTTDPNSANNAAWFAALAPGSDAHVEVLVRLAELAVKIAWEEQKPLYLNTLGAALFRAGRFEESIRRLEEGIQRRGGESLPQAWVFLALAHHQLGHGAEARRWLGRFQTYKATEKPDAFWNELEIRLLRREADARILYDPIFPADPFAR